MAGEESKGSRIEKFDGTDFTYWKMQIEDYLYEKKLHLALLGLKLETMKDEDWNLLDRQVLGVIRLTLSRSVAHNVVKEKIVVDLMKALSSMYEKPSANNKVYLMRKLFNLRKEKSTFVVQHLNEFNTITNQLSTVGIEFDDEVRALILLDSLPNSWEAMRMTVSNFAGKSKLKYDDIRDLILSEEVRRRDANIDNAQDQAFVTENKSRGRSKGSNDRKFNGRSQSRDRSQFKETRECFHCGKRGHLRRDCWHLNKEQNKGKYEKINSEKNTTIALIDKDVVVLSIEKQK